MSEASTHILEVMLLCRSCGFAPSSSMLLPKGEAPACHRSPEATSDRLGARKKSAKINMLHWRNRRAMPMRHEQG
jgi:hypothetical protein